MELKLVTLTADDGKEYNAIAFRETGGTADGDAQEQIEAALAERDAALAERDAAVADREAAESECASQHFVTTITPSETSGTLTFKVPFAPDFVTVYAKDQAGFDAFVLDETNNPDNIPGVFILIFIPGAATIGGFAVARRRETTDKATGAASYTQQYGNVSERCKQAENGDVTLTGIKFKPTSASSYLDASFIKGIDYTVVAAKQQA